MMVCRVMWVGLRGTSGKQLKWNFRGGSWQWGKSFGHGEFGVWEGEDEIVEASLFPRY